MVKKKKHKFEHNYNMLALVGFVALVVLFALVIRLEGGPEFYSQEMSKQTSLLGSAYDSGGNLWCKDSDGTPTNGGYNFYKKGLLEKKRSDGDIDRYNDYCVNNGNTLREFYCSGKLKRDTRFACDSEGIICIDGRCGCTSLV